MLTDAQLNLMNKYKLTSAQKRAVELMMKGLTNQEIGDLLHISEKAIKDTLWKLNKLLKTKSRAQVIIFFSERGWFTKENFINNVLPLGR